MPIDQDNIQLVEGVRRLEKMRLSASRWIRERISSHGQPVGSSKLNGYYRVPWALAVNGDRDVASKVLGWIVENALTEDGDLTAGSAQVPFSSQNSSYPLSQIAIGAWHLEQFDVAQRIMKCLFKHFQDPASGGAFVARPEHRHEKAQTDILLSAQMGLACLTTGNFKQADILARWFYMVWDAQPHLPNVLYPTWDKDGLVTSYDEKNAWQNVVAFDRPFQAFYVPGIAAAFLGRHFQQTGEPRSLELANDFLELSARGDGLQWDYRQNMQICKFSWGASVLLDVSPDERYLRYVLRMIDWYEASQVADGRWHPSPFLNPEPSDADDLPKVAEHLLHLVTMETSLGLCATRTLQGAAS